MKDEGDALLQGTCFCLISIPQRGDRFESISGSNASSLQRKLLSLVLRNRAPRWETGTSEHFTPPWNQRASRKRACCMSLDHVAHLSSFLLARRHSTRRREGGRKGRKVLPPLQVTFMQRGRDIDQGAHSLSWPTDRSSECARLVKKCDYSFLPF